MKLSVAQLLYFFLSLVLADLVRNLEINEKASTKCNATYSVQQHPLSDKSLNSTQTTTFWPETIDEDNADMIDWSTHPCKRTCRDNEPSKKCYYMFQVEQYLSMSKACYNCPKNITDCFRPHCIPADGTERPLVVANRQMPGPAIEVCEGDNVIVDVVNRLRGESTTIHWHGQHLRHNAFMDGVPFISQCPISFGNTFRYDFVAATPGTHFWHSHVGFQRSDGLYGSLIVRQTPKHDKLRYFYDFDEHYIIMNEFYHTLSVSTFLSLYHSNGASITPSLLINGQGPNMSTFNRTEGSTVPMATFKVKKDYKYRFRLINAESRNCPIEFTIDSHQMNIISIDGRDIDPVLADSLILHAGERFDVVIEMNQTIDSYWMKFRGLPICEWNKLMGYQLAILRYEGAPNVFPETKVDSDSIYNQAQNITHQINSINKDTEVKGKFTSVADLTSLDEDSEDNSNEPDYKFYISYDVYGINHPEFHRKHLYGYNQVEKKYSMPQLNRISMKMPKYPLMSQINMIDSRQFCNASTVKNCKTEYCTCTHMLQVKLNSVVELILINEGKQFRDIEHPFHLHGHSFRVIAMERLGRNTTHDEVMKVDSEGRITRKLRHSPIKDTVAVPDGGYAVLRFYANNPGYWLLHCHVDFHLEAGMALIFKVGEQNEFPSVPAGFPRCG